ncbi:MAG: hypothetical protein ABSH22_12080 [Tepidisphaeraceae bacterium]
MSLSGLLGSRGSLGLAAILVFFATVAFYAADATPVVIWVALSQGGIAVLWTVGASASGAVLLRFLGVETNRGLFFATAAALGLGLFSLAALGLGLAGKLSQITTILLPVPGLVAGFVQFARAQPWRKWTLADLGLWLAKPAGSSWLWLVPIVFLAMAVVGACIMPGTLWRPDDPHPYDVLSYHLQVPRQWYELGRIVPLGNNVFSFFPFNAEMQDLLVMNLCGGPWKGMYVTQFLSLMYAVLMVVAIAGARSEGKSSIFPAALAGIIPWVVMLSCVAYVETLMLLFTALAFIWAIRWMGGEGMAIDRDAGRRTLTPTLSLSTGRGGKSSGPPQSGVTSDSDGGDSWKSAALAGVFAGFACGVKLTCVPMVAVAIPAALIAAILFCRGADRPKCEHCLRDIIVFSIVAMIVLLPWLIRNFAWAGNPIFPLAMNILGSGGFSAGQVDRFVAAHSPRADQLGLVARLSAVRSEILTHWQYGFVLIPLAIIVSIKRWKRPRVLFLLFALAINIIVWTFFTHLIGRFFLTSVPIAALLLGEMNWGRSVYSMAGAAVILLAQAVISAAYIDGRLENFCELGREGLFGIHDTNFVFAELPQGADPGRPIALLGDAGAFLYQIPSSRLQYQTVFDIPATDSQPKNLRELLADWFGPDAASKSGDWLIILNPSEIERLSRTYRHVPGLPKDYAGPRDEPVLLDGAKVNGTGLLRSPTP